MQNQIINLYWIILCIVGWNDHTSIRYNSIYTSKIFSFLGAVLWEKATKEAGIASMITGTALTILLDKTKTIRLLVPYLVLKYNCFSIHLN